VQSSCVSTEDREATLLLEVARARRDVRHAQKQLMECLNRETKLLCALHQLKAKKFTELVDDVFKPKLAGSAQSAAELLK